MCGDTTPPTMTPSRWAISAPTSNTNGKFQQLTIEYDSTPQPNTVTINFGSGAYKIFDNSGNPEPHHAYVNTAPNGAGLANANTVATWAALSDTRAADTLLFKGDTAQNIDHLGNTGLLAGIATALTTGGPYSSGIQ